MVWTSSPSLFTMPGFSLCLIRTAVNTFCHPTWWNNTNQHEPSRSISYSEQMCDSYCIRLLIKFAGRNHKEKKLANSSCPSEVSLQASLSISVLQAVQKTGPTRGSLELQTEGAITHEEVGNKTDELHVVVLATVWYLFAKSSRFSSKNVNWSTCLVCNTQVTSEVNNSFTQCLRGWTEALNRRQKRQSKRVDARHKEKSGPFSHHPYGLIAQKESHYWPIVPVSHWLTVSRRTRKHM